MLIRLCYYMYKKRESFRLLRNNDNRNLGGKIFIHVKENKWHVFLPVVTKMEALVCGVRHEAACI